MCAGQVVLVVRGTTSLADALTDLTGHLEPFDGTTASHFLTSHGAAGIRPGAHGLTCRESCDGVKHEVTLDLVGNRWCAAQEGAFQPVLLECRQRCSAAALISTTLSPLSSIHGRSRRRQHRRERRGGGGGGGTGGRRQGVLPPRHRQGGHGFAGCSGAARPSHAPPPIPTFPPPPAPAKPRCTPAPGPCNCCGGHPLPAACAHRTSVVAPRSRQPMPPSIAPEPHRMPQTQRLSTPNSISLR